MRAKNPITKAILGDADNEIIKAGTLATTRGIGVVAASLIAVFFLMDQLRDSGPWKDFTAQQQLLFVLAAGLIWVLLAAADSIARGLAARATAPRVVALPAGLTATRTAGVDSPGWCVVALEVGGPANKFYLVKGTESVWVTADDVTFT